MPPVEYMPDRRVNTRPPPLKIGQLVGVFAVDRHNCVTEVQRMALSGSFIASGAIGKRLLLDMFQPPIRSRMTQFLSLARQNNYRHDILPIAHYGPVQLRRYDATANRIDGSVRVEVRPVNFCRRGVYRSSTLFNDILFDLFGNPYPVWGDHAAAIARLCQDQKQAKSDLFFQSLRLFRQGEGSRGEGWFCAALGDGFGLLRITDKKAKEVLHGSPPGPEGLLVRAVA